MPWVLSWLTTCTTHARSTLQQLVERSPLFHCTVGQNQCVKVKFNTVNFGFYSKYVNQAVEIISCGSQIRVINHAEFQHVKLTTPHPERYFFDCHRCVDYYYNILHQERIARL
jgi:hypothetical protein